MTECLLLAGAAAGAPPSPWICWLCLHIEAPTPTRVQPCRSFSLNHTSFMAHRCLVITVQPSKLQANESQGKKCAGPFNCGVFGVLQGHIFGWDNFNPPCYLLLLCFTPLLKCTPVTGALFYVFTVSGLMRGNGSVMFAGCGSLRIEQPSIAAPPPPHTHTHKHPQPPAGSAAVTHDNQNEMVAQGKEHIFIPRCLRLQ